MEDCRVLDVNELTDAVEHPGTDLTVRWGPEDDPSAAFAVRLLPQNGDAEKAIALGTKYTITDGRTAEKPTRDSRVPIEYAECNFGGERPCFRGSGVDDAKHCDRRSCSSIDRHAEICFSVVIVTTTDILRAGPLVTN